MIYVLSILSWFLGYQVYNKDFLLLSGHYNYRIGQPQMVTFISALLGIILICYEMVSSWFQLSFCIPFLIVAVISEFILSRINPLSAFISTSYRLLIILFLCTVLVCCGLSCIFPFFVIGWYVRNTPFGVPHKNILVLAKFLKHNLPDYDEKEIVIDDIPQMMPDFTFAGNNISLPHNLPIYDVTDNGIVPNTNEDLIERLQELTDEIGKKGGGIIYFPKGKYQFNKKSKREFLRINYSNIVFDGELDEVGNPQAELVNCGTTVEGSKNPWLSPFFITTGENLQRSNIFFGLQFKNKKNVVTKSASMSDPGSDGTILTPEYVTDIIADGKCGEDVVVVENAAKIGKYIMIGMYNTTNDGNLIKDILGIDIRLEWRTALRAGEERAPSFQWLIEVKEVIDNHHVRLTRPLLRNIQLIYEPKVFNVPMLENVVIMNLKISSCWNGLFRHHGQRRYYSIDQTQEMDYGWNCINMKRVAHGHIKNLRIINYTNPLYLLDSRNITVEGVTIQGHDGHQGIKLYEHACDNLIKDILFECHYADMMGGEGNAYGNVFSNIIYNNSVFKPCDYDFHGFSEGPMSPPSFNLFQSVSGFRYIKMAGAIYNQPACAQWNFWWNCSSEGEKKGESIFRSLLYQNPHGLKYAILEILKVKRKRQYVLSLNQRFLENDVHYLLFKNIWLFGMRTTMKLYNNDNVKSIYSGLKCKPTSLIDKS